MCKHGCTHREGKDNTLRVTQKARKKFEEIILTPEQCSNRDNCNF